MTYISQTDDWGQQSCGYHRRPLKEKTAMEKKTFVSRRPATGKENTTEESQTKVWQSYHAVTERWKSDLQFEKDEVNFFRKLISEHFTQFMNTEHAERSRKLVAELIKLDKRREDLLARISRHDTQMLKILEDPDLIVDELLYKHNHEQLENDVFVFMKDHRSMKKKLMVLAEDILRTEKIMHLLRGN